MLYSTVYLIVMICKSDHQTQHITVCWSVVEMQELSSMQSRHRGTLATVTLCSSQFPQTSEPRLVFSVVTAHIIHQCQCLVRARLQHYSNTALDQHMPPGQCALCAKGAKIQLFVLRMINKSVRLSSARGSPPASLEVEAQVRGDPAEVLKLLCVEQMCGWGVMVVTVLLVLVISGHLGAGHTQQTLQTDGRPRHQAPRVAPGIHKNIFNQFHLGSTIYPHLENTKEFMFYTFFILLQKVPRGRGGQLIMVGTRRWRRP